MNEIKNPREWNAADYHRLSAPQFHWGQRVLKDLQLRGDEFLLDVGCGTGKLTRLLLENLPHGRVVGLDLSRNMVLHARQDLLPDFHTQVSFVAADIVVFPFRSCFDGIFSTACLHWIHDHDALFRSLFAVLRPGGWLHAQCGGGSNLASLRQRVKSLSQDPAYSQWLGTFPEPWYFSDAQSAASRLHASGFENVERGLEQAHYSTSQEEFPQYLRTFVLHRHLELLPDESVRSAFLQQLTRFAGQDDPPWTLDYCRLNLRARKPG